MKKLSVLFAAFLFLAAAPFVAAATPIHIVAAENFYGDIVSQLGGANVQVLSILSDPNVDPHEYESNVNDAAAISEADLIIANGGGYDDWIDKLLSASPNSHRVVLKGFDLATTKLPENEHVWYNPGNVQVIATALVAQLKGLDPAHSAQYDQNLKNFVAALSQVSLQIKQIKAKKENTPVGLTETIFLYQTKLIGLNVLTPFEFQKAVAEGEDPPAASVVLAESQLKGKKVKVLIFNSQTSTPVTSKLLDDARAAGIPIVSVTETMPEGSHYQDWMLKQLDDLQKALGK